MEHSLMSDFQLCPFTPYFGQVVNRLEIDLCRLLKNLPSVVQVWFSLVRCSTFLVKLGKVDVKPVEVCGRSARIDSCQCLCVSLCNL